MRAASSLLRSLRGWLRLAAAMMALLTTLAAPAALGASLHPVMEMLGAATAEHVCKCGMKRGTCGCPACADLPTSHASDSVPDILPVLKRQCENGAPAFAFGTLPTGALATAAFILPASATGRRSERAADSPLPLLGLAPPTPPPRPAAI